jgi:hypothetical protein
MSRSGRRSRQRERAPETGAARTMEERRPSSKDGTIRIGRSSRPVRGTVWAQVPQVRAWERAAWERAAWERAAWE